MRAFSVFRLNDRMPQNKFSADAGHPNCSRHLPSPRPSQKVAVGAAAAAATATAVAAAARRISKLVVGRVVSCPFWWLECEHNRGIGLLQGVQRFFGSTSHPHTLQPISYHPFTSHLVQSHPLLSHIDVIIYRQFRGRSRGRNA